MSVAHEVHSTAASSFEEPEPDPESELITIEMSAGAVSLLDRLIAKFGGRGGLVFAEAFALLDIAVTAQEEGSHVAVVNKDGEIQTRIDVLAKG